MGERISGMAVGKKRVLLSWSSGKDCAWALHLLRQRQEVEVVALVTSFNEAFGRVAMHAVRRDLVLAQAERAGLPLWEVALPWPCTNIEYEARMNAAWQRAAEEGIQQVAFGDLFLEDIRAYRVAQLAGTGLEPIFPVWGIPTCELARQMLAAGVKARLTCVDPRQLDAGFAGREFDRSLLEDLPVGVDACGENGEFHTFCYASPEFAEEIAVEAGEVVERDGFVFADLQRVGL
jgi:uncharacterized protein (TIGR00290 family)